MFLFDSINLCYLLCTYNVLAQMSFSFGSLTVVDHHY